MSESQLFEICDRALAAQGYVLVDLDYVRESDGFVLRVFFDHPFPADGTLEDPKERRRVGLEDCQRASRQLGTVLDVEDPIPGRYRLEVSSPGLKRRLRKAADFARFVGYDVAVRLNEGVNGRRNFSGKLVAADSATVGVDVDGTQYQLPLSDLKRASLVQEY